MLRFYVFVTFTIAVLLGFEYAVLNKVIVAPDLIDFIPILKGIDRDPSPGRAMSFWLGVFGFAILCLTNLYILRKKLTMMRSWGRTKNWLDFHIFCGMLGPVLIVFHSNFKIGGLVAVSFWSMVISALSGVVGRYFYMQLLRKKSDLVKVKEYYQGLLVQAGEKTGKYNLKQMQDQTRAVIRRIAGGKVVEERKVGLISALMSSIIGDLRIRFFPIKTPQGLPGHTKNYFKEVALAQRRIVFLDSFKKIMGYWHAFHVPFAVFMYIVAILHIVVALIFKVDH